MKLLKRKPLPPQHFSSPVHSILIGEQQTTKSSNRNSSTLMHPVYFHLPQPSKSPWGWVTVWNIKFGEKCFVKYMRESMKNHKAGQTLRHKKEKGRVTLCPSSLHRKQKGGKKMHTVPQMAGKMHTVWSICLAAKNSENIIKATIKSWAQGYSRGSVSKFPLQCGTRTAGLSE